MSWHQVRTVAAVAAMASLVAACSGIRIGGPYGGDASAGSESARTSQSAPCDRGLAPAGQAKVCRGDTLISLAHFHNVTVPNLKRANGLADDLIYADTFLTLPNERVHIVRVGETLTSISRLTGVPVATLVAINGITNPHILLPETRLAIPTGPTLVAERRQPRPEPSATITHAEPATPPTVTANAPPRSETRSDADPPSVTIGNSTEKTATPSSPREEVGTQVAAIDYNRFPHPRPRPKGRASSSAAQAPQAQNPDQTAAPRPATEAAGVAFLLPVEGRILTDFGPTSGGLHNDGINIAAPQGTAIRAAADGQVAYAGDGLPGFGNLVLIKHRDGWTSAYAHASSMSVKRGDRVRRGQAIGQVGSTGSVNEPQLHFELRHHDRAVDPKTKVQ